MADSSSSYEFPSLKKLDSVLERFRSTAVCPRTDVDASTVFETSQTSLEQTRRSGTRPAELRVEKAAIKCRGELASQDRDEVARLVHQVKPAGSRLWSGPNREEFVRSRKSLFAQGAPWPMPQEKFLR